MNGHTNNRLARLTLQSLHKKARGRLAEAKLEMIAAEHGLNTVPLSAIQLDINYWQGNVDALEEADILLGLDAFKTETV